MRKLLSCLVGLVLLCQPAISQTPEISGKVSDEKGTPIPGVSVQEKSTKRGTTTDANGFFKLTVKSWATLIFTSIGFDTKQIVVDKSGNQSITLTASNTALSEVVVTGVGAATSKKKLGVAVESINL